MTARTTDHPSQARSESPRVRFRWWWPVIVVAALVALVATTRLTGTSPATVDSLTVVNRGRYDLAVAATGASRDGRTPIGTVAAGATKEFRDVIDQGPHWVIRFSAQGEDGGEVAVDRATLASAGWRVVVPSAVDARLRDAGAPPSPQHT
jgi:hypothetical protein